MDRISFYSKNYWDAFFSKLFSFFISLKWQFFASVFPTATVLLIKDYITSADYVKIITVISTIIGIREIIKIKDIGSIILSKMGDKK